MFLSPYILTGVDVRRQSDPDSSRVQIIDTFKAPAIKRKTIEHAHGGGIGSVKYVLPTVEAFEPTFETFGPDLDAYASLGLMAGAADTWVFAGSYLQRGAAKPVSSRIILKGVVAEVDEGAHAGAGADKQKSTHALHEVTHYERWVDGKEWVFWDPGQLIFRINGVDLFAAYRAALGI